VASYNGSVAGTGDVKRKETCGCFVRHQALPCRDFM
jgi:hypothetical protein